MTRHAADRRAARHGARTSSGSATLIERCAEAGRLSDDDRRSRAPPTTIVFGTDGWRARIADDFTFENVRRCADGVAAYVASGASTAKGVVIAYDRRFASEHFAAAAAEVLLAHDIPVAFAAHAVPDPDELVRGRPARRRRGDRHHRQPQPVGRQRVQGQGADRRRGRRRRSSRSSRRGSRRTAATTIERRPFADAEAAGLVERFDPFEGYERFVRRTVDLDALEAADISSSSTRCTAPAPAGSRGCSAGGRIRVDEIHQERNPYFGGINPEPIRPNVDEALGDPRGRRLRPRPAARRRRGPGGRGRRAAARSSTSSRSPGC